MTKSDKDGHLGFVMLYLCSPTWGWFPKQDGSFATNHLTNNQNRAFMFTNSTFSNPNWLQQKDHESSFDTRPVIVRFSLTSRSVLVRSSFVSRSSLVGYSLVYRRPIENRTRNKQKTNERATNIDRDADEKLSATRRFATVMAGRMSFCNHRTAYCPSPYSCRGR